MKSILFAQLTAALLVRFALSAPAVVAQMPMAPPNVSHPWDNRSLSPDVRADMVLKRRTLDEKLQLVHGTGPGIVLNPGTPISLLTYLLDDVDLITIMTVNPGFFGQALVPSTLRKLADLRRFIDSEGHGDLEIEVDGNVSFQNIPVMLKAGATMLVDGTASIFSREHTIEESVRRVRRMIDSGSGEIDRNHFEI